MVTAITAAYSNVTVTPAAGENGKYIKKVTLYTETDEKNWEQSIETPDGNKAFVVPTETIYHYNTSKMYISAELAENLPEGYQAYAVYENPKDGTVQRVLISDSSRSYMKNAIAAKAIYGSMVNYNKAIKNIRIEVKNGGMVVDFCELEIRYKNHLDSLTITDPWGESLDTGLKENLDDQELVVYAARNAEYIDIYPRTSGIMEMKADIETDVENALTGSGVRRLALDWNTYDKYVLRINIVGNGDVVSEDTASYTLTILPGDIKYIPEVLIKANMETAAGWGNSSYLQVYAGNPVVNLTAEVQVDKLEEGVLSYQWYYIQTPFKTGIYIPENVVKEDYIKLEGSTEKVLTVNPDEPWNGRCYCCIATFTIDGRSYSATSNFIEISSIKKEIDIPVITKQPESAIYTNGQPFDIKLNIETEKAPWLNLYEEYQWYKCENDDNYNGTAIKGASQSTYVPEIPEDEKDYYYCAVRFYRNVYKNGEYQKEYSEYIYSDIVSISKIAEELPWQGNGSSTTPFLLNNLSDLEALRDKVNKDGYSFDGMYFQLTDDIKLSSEWIPIGTFESGHTTSGNGKYIWAFSGIFDGNSYTVTMADGGKPLFNFVRNAVIENLNLTGTNINGYGLVNGYTIDYGVDGNYNTGCPITAMIRNVTLKSGMSTKKAGLIGGTASGANTVFIENCKAESGVVIGYTGQEQSIGTFAGAFNGVIRNCHSAATVYGTSKVGGLVGAKGQSMGACRIENSSFTGTVTASGNWVGGILGSGYEADSAPNTPVASVKNCYVAGNVSGAANVGGIFGGEPSVKQCWGNGSGSITNNFFYGSVSGSSNVGAIIGYLRSFDKFQNISNNYYLDTCGAAQGIGAIGVILSAEGGSQTLPFEYDASYGIDYVFDQNLYCFAKTASEFADGTVRAGLNSGDYSNWAQGSAYPVYGQGAYATGLTLSGDYKKEYYLGEALDLSGGTFTVTWSDGSKTHPQADEITVIGYDSNKRGSQMLQLKYGAVETTITVSVLLKAGQFEVKFTLLGDSIHDSDSDHDYHTLARENLETWIPETTYIVSNNTKVKDALEQALRENNMTCENPTGNYVSAITRNGVKLEEFSNGKYSGWMYTLNGKHPDLGVNEQYLNSGDVIIFHYTDYYVEEEHKHQWSDQWQSNDTAHWHECEYSCGQQKDLASHSWNAGAVTKKATCTKNGVRTYTCSVCGAQKTEKIPASGHKFGSWRKASDATVFAAEVQKRSCSRCGTSEKKTVGRKLTPVLELPGKLSSFSIKKGITTTLTVTMAGGDSVASVKSSASKILKASLDKKTGKITLKALKAGSAKLSIRLASGKSKTYTVKVVTGIIKTTGISVTSVTNKKLTLTQGKTHTLKTEVKPFTSTQELSYKSSDKKVATVTSKGKIKAAAPGKATITVTSGSENVKITVTVPGITIAKSSVTVKKNKTTTLKPKVYGISGKVTYASSNKKIATVTSKGTVKGIKKGTAKITIKAGSYKKTVTIKVN